MSQCIDILRFFSEKKQKKLALPMQNSSLLLYSSKVHKNLSTLINAKLYEFTTVVIRAFEEFFLKKTANYR